jgi:hypothetical protein
VATHRFGDFVYTEQLANPVPNDPAGFSPESPRGIAFLKKCQGVIEPQQLNQAAGISIGVVPWFAHCLETQSVGRSLNE